MHRTQKTTNEPAPSEGMSPNAAACMKNISRKVARPPILSESVGQKILPTASAAEATTIRVEASTGVAPAKVRAIDLTSEMSARPAVAPKKKMAKRQYS